MSLLVRPVSPSDLTQLQLGIEFFMDSNEANAEASLITDPPGTPTVYSYAGQLLAKNISLSQVAMAVDSLMFGVTDNIAELTKLATQFLPSQVAVANANGFNPTVYAAEALGLALAGGNGTSNAFATSFGSLSLADFASAVANLTGINSGAIQGFAQSWIGFYTANPSATFGLPVTLAAYGAAFGDTVGAALLNPTVNGSLGLLVSEEQNALIDNAEGSYKVGIALIEEPSHLPLQGEALLIPGAGGPPFGPTIDWASVGAPGPYGQFVAPAQTADLTINNAPSIFTLNTQHFGTKGIEVHGHAASLFTLIVGDSAASESLGKVFAGGYSTANIVNNGPGTDIVNVFILQTAPPIVGNLVISGSNDLFVGNIVPLTGTEGLPSSEAGTITDHGVALELGTFATLKIDASDAPVLDMASPVAPEGAATGVTVLGGSNGSNELQGSLGTVSTVTFSNGATGVAASAFVGADNFTGGSGGGDTINGDGGADVITLPNHSAPDRVIFGLDVMGNTNDVLAITNGNDVAFLGTWGASTTTATIPSLFSGGITGGTSADMTVITGFRAGNAGDVLDFELAAWNGDSFGVPPFMSAVTGDLVALNGVFVPQVGDANLSAVWVNSGSNSDGSLAASDEVLRYAPADASLHNAQQLAAQLHTSSDAIILPGGGAGSGFIAPGKDLHILVAYDASTNVGGNIQPAVNIADVDLVNTSANNQSSTANLNVYASDMAHLVGVSLSSLTSHDIHFELHQFVF